MIKQSFAPNEGSILILTAFITFAFAVFLVGLWKLMRANTMALQASSQHIKAEYAAYAGLEDALFELKQYHSWTLSEISSDWNHAPGSPDNTFYKSTNATRPLTYFDSPTTYSVQVSENIETGHIWILSSAQVGIPNHPEIQSNAIISGSITRTISNRLIIEAIEE